MTSIKRTKLIASAAVGLLVITVATGLFLGAQTRRQFSEIAASWSVYAEDPEKKGIWISSLRGYLGYGGIIHTFKNYVIRKKESYRQRMLDQLAQYDDVMNSYLAVPLPAAERRLLNSSMRPSRSTGKSWRSPSGLHTATGRQSGQIGWSKWTMPALLAARLMVIAFAIGPQPNCVNMHSVQPARSQHMRRPPQQCD